MSKSAFIALLGAALLALAGVADIAAQDERPAAETRDPGAAAGATLVVTMKEPSEGDPFWALVEQGALQAGADYGVAVQVVAPTSESDTAGQIALVEDSAAQGAAGVAIAVTDATALEPAVQAALDQGVKVVWIDSGGSNEGITTIGTDDAVGAALAGQYLCDAIPQGGEVAILQGLLTTASGQARAEGAKAAVTECGLDLVIEVPADGDPVKGRAATEDILTQHPHLAGLFAGNDEMALSAVEALRTAGLLKQVVVVGYDARPKARDAIVAGDLEASVARNPFNVGYSGVESLIRLINGETLPPTIDTGVELITAENAAE
jgi:ribose transport system substrate-binding protein